MFIPSQSTDKFGVSIIKRNNKLSICVAKKENNKVILLKNLDKDFPFPNPFVTNSAIKIFEFIIEVNNYIKNIQD